MRVRIVICSVFLFLVSSSFALGQDISAKITGLVTDVSGAAISGAVVEARDVARGTVYPTKTNSSGIYYLSPLPIGD